MFFPPALALATLDASTGAATAALSGSALALVLRAGGPAETFGGGGLTLGEGDTLLLLAGGADGQPLPPIRLAEIAAAFQGDELRGMGEAVLNAVGLGACLLLARRRG